MTTETSKKEKILAVWRSRKTLKLTYKHMLRLKKGKQVYVVSDGIGYALHPHSIPEIFDSHGARLNKAALKRLLRAVK